ncbi:MAG: hypothetical protein PQJ60_08100 [Spirochaetales bacterium]|nr:hypothetical protein [Spirochaetales bacterium]
MADCEHLGDCPFFNGSDDEDTKSKYCRNNNLNCALYMVFNSCGKDKVPADLAPDDKPAAYMIIAENG